MAEDRLDGMLFRQDRKQYGRIREEARSFRAQCGGLPLRDDIFPSSKISQRRITKLWSCFGFPFGTRGSELFLLSGKVWFSV